jgi:hypothetical protein
MSKLEIHDILQPLANVIDETLKMVAGKKMGFFLVTFEFEKTPENTFGNYISNANREDCINALRNTANQLEEKGKRKPWHQN